MSSVWPGAINTAVAGLGSIGSRAGGGWTVARRKRRGTSIVTTSTLRK
jgi:hypothetical protein